MVGRLGIAGNIGTGVGAGVNSVRFILFPRVTPGTIRGFAARTGGNCCGNLVFREVVGSFVVRNNSPANANYNNRSIFNGGFRSRFDLSTHGCCNTLSVTGTNPGAGNDRFFVIRTGSIPRGLLTRVRRLGRGNFPRRIVSGCGRINNAP